MHQYKFETNISIIISILIMYCLYKNTTHDTCHHILMCDRRDKNTNL